jgi:tRNA (guanine37-N1)-methyltransferase
MRIDIITIFPEMFPGVLGASILKRAQEQGRIEIAVHDLRRYTHDKHRSVDDRPYGGGPGMVMKPEPIAEAVEDVRRRCCRGAHGAQAKACQTVLLSPQGERFSPAIARELAQMAHVILLCGHYEGVDDRVRALLADRSVSIGDYVLTGGELPALVVTDVVARFVPGVIGHEEATAEESFTAGLLEYPQYTRPLVFRGVTVPEVLLPGDHGAIAKWRQRQSVAKTLAVRPDLITKRTYQVGNKRQATSHKQQATSDKGV